MESVNAFDGIRNVGPGLIEMRRTYGLTRWGFTRKLFCLAPCSLVSSP
jgi:ABC-type nitrate/sulfonate/bicarbonate transport system permease component